MKAACVTSFKMSPLISVTWAVPPSPSPMSLGTITILYCFSLPHSLEDKPHENRHLICFCLLLYPQHLEHFFTHSREKNGKEMRSEEHTSELQSRT